MEGNWCLSRSTRVGFTFVRVDVDTKGFPDSLLMMVSCMKHDEQLRRNKDCEQSGDLRDDDAGWVMSCSFLTSFTRFRLAFEY